LMYSVSYFCAKMHHLKTNNSKTYPTRLICQLP